MPDLNCLDTSDAEYLKNVIFDLLNTTPTPDMMNLEDIRNTMITNQRGSVIGYSQGLAVSEYNYFVSQTSHQIDAKPKIQETRPLLFNNNEKKHNLYKINGGDI